MGREGGSSPRTWGTAAACPSIQNERRFIPTHVGNRLPLRSASALSTVHPHARGEQQMSQCPTGCSDGSSPRTWGTGHVGNDAVRQTRFIPTHVGNSQLTISHGTPLAVHPHARGEQADEGSAQERCVRFIPTHVGNRLPLRLKFTVMSGSSPRTWGTGTAICASSSLAVGSSPRTWGTVPWLRLCSR